MRLLSNLYVVFEITANGYERIAYSVRTEEEAKRIITGLNKRLHRIGSPSKTLYRLYTTEEETQ